MLSHLKSVSLLAFLALTSPLLADKTEVKPTPEETLHNNLELSQAETEAWLGKLDKGQYGESWDKGSLMFRNTIKRDEWIKAMDKIRKPLGSLNSRSILDVRTSKDPKGLPAGDYMVYFYKSSFANKKEAYELVTLVQESDGQWRVLTYQAN